MVQATPFEYRCARTHSMVDVGTTVRKLAQEGGTSDVTHLIPLFLERLVEPRVCVFTLLGDPLGQPFSLDNGLALQDTAPAVAPSPVRH